jgi:S-adenosylmethionine:tRNA ribosyltransferase-isomerase
MLSTSQLEYELPKDRIATRPALPRDAAKLLLVSRTDPATITHAYIRDLHQFLDPSDLLVRNTTAVLAARLAARRADTNAKVTGLFLESITPSQWRCLFKANTTLRPDTVLNLVPQSPASTTISLTLQQKHPDGSWTVRVENPDNLSLPTLLNNVGLTPLPPYILAQRKLQNISEPDANDRLWYHTIFEDPATLDHKGGSVAAPTAGLHITQGLLDTLTTKGISIADVVLHVGQGTFKPIQTPTLDEHPMHAERFLIPQKTLDAILATRNRAGRVIALGTTTTRALESINNHNQLGQWHDTSLLIAPGHHFQNIDALLTNFHLPRSTLLAMVAALFPRGLDDLLPIYNTAIEHNYRFYSYGDAMLILP